MWSELWGTVIEAFTSALTFLHDLVAAVPLFEAAAWGWAIVLLTLIVRILMLPLAVKQTRSMRAMQKLQPQIKELQKKHKVDRSLLKKDPEQYRAKRQKLNEEMMALYQREGANPAASCLPLLAQAPIFIALFWTLRDAPELRGAEFYFFTMVGEGGLEMTIRAAGWPGWLLILVMSGTMFWSQKQMMAKNAAQMADSPMAQQQKILLYVMPVFLAVISFQFPMGVVLYWATTNLWQVAQQAIILREVQHELAEEAERGGQRPSSGGPTGPSKGATSGRQKATGGPQEPDASKDRGAAERPPGKPRSSRKKSGDTPPPSEAESRDAEGSEAGHGDKPRRRKRGGGPDERTPPERSDQRGRDGDARADGGRTENGRLPRRGRDSSEGGRAGGAPKPDKKGGKRDHLPRRGETR